MYAFAEATVPKLTVITRKAYGGAYIVMNSKQTGADVNFAYPSAEIAVMGAEGAVNILFRKADAETKAQELNVYKEKFATPYQAAELGFIDEIILPKQTRKRLIQALEMTENKMQTNRPRSTETCRFKQLADGVIIRERRVNTSFNTSSLSLFNLTTLKKRFHLSLPHLVYKFIRCIHLFRQQREVDKRCRIGIHPRKLGRSRSIKHHRCLKSPFLQLAQMGFCTEIADMPHTTTLLTPRLRSCRIKSLFSGP